MTIDIPIPSDIATGKLIINGREHDVNVESITYHEEPDVMSAFERRMLNMHKRTRTTYTVYEEHYE